MSIINVFRQKWQKHVQRRRNRQSAYYRGIEKNHIFCYQKEIYRRSALPLQDIEELSQPIDDSWLSSYAIDTEEPLYYGAIQALLDYAGLSLFSMPPVKLGIQHGYVFEICNWEKSKLDIRNLVWSKRLVEMYREYTANPDIYAIGAPFFYATSLLNEEQLQSEKKRLGRNLLAFPMHSETHVDTNYNPQKFLDILAEERKHFDTVRVCMYWKDVLRGIHKVFEDAGYECVCNGHLFDPNFLRRQKSLFELADATISNGVGSHIGYSLYMGKPHWLIDDEYEYVNSSKIGDAEELTDVANKENFLRVKRAFLNNADYKITTSQRDIIDEFWGISAMKTPEELKKLLLYLYDLQESAKSDMA